jgi:hypothetical protein
MNQKSKPQNQRLKRSADIPEKNTAPGNQNENSKRKEGNKQKKISLKLFLVFIKYLKSIS